MKVWFRSICSEYQTLTPHSDRRKCAISSAATPARSIDADCPRANVAGGPTIRSFPQLDPSVAPASQIQSAQWLEPSAIFHCSSQDFLVCGSFAFSAGGLIYIQRIYRLILWDTKSRLKCVYLRPTLTMSWPAPANAF